MTYWPHTRIAHAALWDEIAQIEKQAWVASREQALTRKAAFLDELTKIGAEDKPPVIEGRPTVKSVAKTVGQTALGAGIGGGAGYLVTKKIPWTKKLFDKPHTKNKLKAVQIGLPIAGALMSTLVNRYNKRVDESLFNKKRSP